jgi:hypothetical protein
MQNDKRPERVIIITREITRTIEPRPQAPARLPAPTSSGAASVDPMPALKGIGVFVVVVCVVLCFSPCCGCGWLYYAVEQQRIQERKEADEKFNEWWRKFQERTRPGR